MNKKLFAPVLLMGMLFTNFSFNKPFNVSYADDVINLDVDTIIPLSHFNGETVNFINDDMFQYWGNNETDFETLRSLYEMNNEITSYASNSKNYDYCRDLFAKWDDFKPVNNVLSWKSNVSVNSYDVTVALDAEMTNALYEAKGLTEACYKMENPLANTHYYWQVTANTNDGVIKSQIFDFYSGNHKRTIEIPSVSNSRDVGGFTGLYGEMKQGLIFRGGCLDYTTSESLSVLHQLDIQTDLDLRNLNEGLENPAGLSNYYLKTLQMYTNDLAPQNRAKTVDAVRVFANANNYPVYFHCAIGRDRTGTLAILLQALCGASKEYIIHDYYTSMWSVVASYQKTLADMNFNIVNQTLQTLEDYSGAEKSINVGAENFLKQSSTQSVGLTEEEIQTIRDIWSGRTNIEHGQKIFKPVNNYEGKAYVNIKAVGHKDIAMMVNKGSKISAPYELDASFAWFSNGEAFDFANTINDTTYIYADFTTQYVITIHFVGATREDEILRKYSGEIISMSRYELEGYDMMAISDEGREVTRFEVYRDAYINVIYSQK